MTKRENCFADIVHSCLFFPLSPVLTLAYSILLVPLTWHVASVRTCHEKCASVFVVFPEEWPHRANFKPTASEGQVSACLFVGLCGYEQTEGKGEREEERETCLSLLEINSIHWKKKTSQFFSVIRRELSLYFCSNHLHGAQENATRSVHRNSIRGQTRISPHLHSNYY